MITDRQKEKTLRIINVFETGKADGKYDTIALLKDGPGKIKQITYGRSQTTEFGNLKRLIEKYIAMEGVYKSDFVKYVNKIGKKPSLCTNTTFLKLLKEAAQKDEIMRTCQDEFFDSYYYMPAYAWFNGFGFKEALSLLVIYDSFIHSGQIRNDIRQKFPERPPVSGGNERKWIEQYVNARHDWLKNHSNSLLHKTVYRTECFKKQIKDGNWDLSKPVKANGVTIQ